MNLLSSIPQEAADLAGIPSGRRVFTAFLISGALAGFAGALFLALHAQVDVTGGTGYIGRRLVELARRDLHNLHRRCRRWRWRHGPPFPRRQ